MARGTSAFQLYDRDLTARVGRGGLPGSLALVLPRLSTPAFLHAVGTPWLAWLVARRPLRSAHCPACRQWLPVPRNAAVVPLSHALPLVSAVTSGDADAAWEVVTETAGVPLGLRCGVARAYRCTACGCRSVDVVGKTFGKGQTSESVLLRPVSVTEAFYDALRSEPVVPVVTSPDGGD